VLYYTFDIKKLRRKQMDEINEMLDKSIDTITNITDQIGQKYEIYLREKAIEKVEQKLNKMNIKIEDVSDEDYEVMINDEVNNLKKEYATNVAKVALGVLGFDMIFGW